MIAGRSTRVLAIEPKPAAEHGLPTAQAFAWLQEADLLIFSKIGRLAFGTWQGVYLFEHRHAPTAERSPCI